MSIHVNSGSRTSLRLFENDADLGSDFRLYQRTLLETARQLQLSSDGRDVLSWLIANSDNDGWIRGITITSWAAELGIDRRKLSAELHSLNGRGVVQLVSVRGHGIDIALSTTTKALLVSTLMYLRKYQNGTYANPQVQKPYLRKYQNGTYDQDKRPLVVVV